MTNEEFAVRAAEYGSRVQYTGATATVLFGLTWNELGIFAGVFFAAAGFLVSWYYRHKASRLSEIRHKAHMEEIALRKQRYSKDPLYYMPDDTDESDS